MTQEIDWTLKYKLFGANLSEYLNNLDQKIFHMITLSKNRESFQHICNVHDINLFLIWQSIYPEIRYAFKGRNTMVSSEDIFIIFLIIQYVSEFYFYFWDEIGNEEDKKFFGKTEELFKWYNSVFPKQTFIEKIQTLHSLFNSHREKKAVKYG